VDSDREALERRVAALEQSVRELAAEVRAQRRAGASAAGADVPLQRTAASDASAPDAGAMSQPRPAPVPPPPAPEFRRPAVARFSQIDFEALVGRYGTLVLATVSGLAAVGTFIGWAISRGWLGPSQRVGLGLLVAAALAVGGFRLRKRERSFGASLLGLSLATVHVCAWGAGPSLHLVPDWMAFLLAAIASIALAVFAHREADEPLWCVGFSGASIAPFVTASEQGNLLLLALYGAAVLSASGFALGARRWIVAGRLFLLAAGLFTAALATGRERDHGPLLGMAFPLAVAVIGVYPWISGWPRRERLRALGALAALAAMRSGFGTDFVFKEWQVAGLIALAGVAWLVLVDRSHAVAATPGGDAPPRHPHEADWVDAAVLPLAFVLGAVIALDATARVSGQALLGASGVLFVMVLRVPRGSLRDAAAFAVVLTALVAEMLLLRGKPLGFTVAIAGLAVSCFAANLAWPSTTWSMMGLIGLAWGMLASLAHLNDRREYAYTPFWTRASAVSALVLVAIAAGWQLARDERARLALRVGVIVWAFTWVHQELAFAISRTVSTLLLVVYYASTSVAAVGIGRVRGIRLARHAGLALAVLAAGTALWGARRLDAIAVRIAADLVAAVFLLAIAYWYRKPGGSAPLSTGAAGEMANT